MQRFKIKAEYVSVRELLVCIQESADGTWNNPLDPQSWDSIELEDEVDFYLYDVTDAELIDKDD